MTDSQRKISQLPRPIIYRMAFLTTRVFHLIYFLFFKSAPVKQKCRAPHSWDGGMLLRAQFKGQGPGGRGVPLLSAPK